MKNSYIANVSDDQNIWTKEARRIEQITALEDKINIYKEANQWGLVLNALEDYLRFQIEAIEEKENKARGVDTKIYKELSEEIINLQLYWDSIQTSKVDPAARQNDREERFQLILRIKKMIDRVYQNNVTFNLTYRKPQKPEDAWME